MSASVLSLPPLRLFEEIRLSVAKLFAPAPASTDLEELAKGVKEQLRGMSALRARMAGLESQLRGLLTADGWESALTHDDRRFVLEIADAADDFAKSLASGMIEESGPFATLARDHVIPYNDQARSLSRTAGEFAAQLRRHCVAEEQDDADAIAALAALSDDDPVVPWSH